MTEAKPLGAEEIAKKIMLAWSDEVPRRPHMVIPPFFLAEIAARVSIATLDQRDEQIKRLQADKREIENAAYERGYKQAVEDATDAKPCPDCDGRGYFANDMIGTSFTPCDTCKAFEQCADGIHVRRKHEMR